MTQNSELVFDVKSCDPASTPLILLRGGTSGEREISLASGAGVEKALIEEGFPVTTLDPADPEFFTQMVDARNAGAKAVFICLHGKGGEDGTMQGLCELLGLPYTGPGVLASALAMDKARAKVHYLDAGLKTPRSINIVRGDDWYVEDIVAVVGNKCVVKPATEGSAIGVYIAHDPAEIAPAVEAVLAIDTQVVIETYIAGTEITAAVLGNENPQALPVVEIVPKNEFYDFESKYAEGGAQHIIPARISDEITARVQADAIKAHKALGCTCVSRTDMIIDEDGTPWLLETNTIPGMTSTSLLPDAASKVGLSYGALCHLLIDFAIEAKA